MTETINHRDQIVNTLRDSNVYEDCHFKTELLIRIWQHTLLSESYLVRRETEQAFWEALIEIWGKSLAQTFLKVVAVHPDKLIGKSFLSEIETKDIIKRYQSSD